MEENMERRPRRIFITDCEGPITKNDNAAELAEAFIPKGDVFFRKISLYDDYLAEVLHKPGYKAGDTLRLILPFFKAFGLDNRTMIKFSRRNIEMVPQADCMLRELADLLPAYIVSTSYSAYIKAVCEVMGFPFDNTFCTEVNLDDYRLRDDDKEALKDIHERIVDLPDFAIPSAAASPEDLSPADRATVARLDEIFWSEMPRLEINRMIEEVNPVGGHEKATAIRKIADIEEAELRDVIYVGDSITDVEAFRMVRAGGGLAVSFNGNNWAIKEASFAVTAQTALPIGWLAVLFVNQGLRGFEDLTMSAVTSESIERISELSCCVRKSVRTEKIGSLG
jgi:energy-converting hydrogenase A subunit R